MANNKNRVTIDCDVCDASGRLKARRGEIVCPDCDGDGWNYADDGTSTFTAIVVKAEGSDEEMQDLLRRTVGGMAQ